MRYGYSFWINEKNDRQKGSVITSRNIQFWYSEFDLVLVTLVEHKLLTGFKISIDVFTAKVSVHMNSQISLASEWKLEKDQLKFCSSSKSIRQLLLIETCLDRFCIFHQSNECEFILPEYLRFDSFITSHLTKFFAFSIYCVQYVNK